MRTRMITLLLIIGLGFCLLMLISRLGGYHLPGNQQGYEPAQPVPFSHRLHAGEQQISCVYCHSGVENGKHAGIPATSLCLNCHKTPVGALGDELALAQKETRSPRVSPGLSKLHESLGLDGKGQADPSRKPRPIPWVRVHSLPDFACFDHRAHVQAGVACQKCHGSVETMERIRQVEDLSMGWCVNCHREVNRTSVSGKKVHASIDCGACHY